MSQQLAPAASANADQRNMAAGAQSQQAQTPTQTVTAPLPNVRQQPAPQQQAPVKQETNSARQQLAAHKRQQQLPAQQQVPLAHLAHLAQLQQVAQYQQQIGHLAHLHQMVPLPFMPQMYHAPMAEHTVKHPVMFTAEFSAQLTKLAPADPQLEIKVDKQGKIVIKNVTDNMEIALSFRQYREIIDAAPEVTGLCAQR